MAVGTYSDSVRVDVSGNIIPNECIMDAGDLNKTVTLSFVTVEELRTGVKKPVEFDFTFTGCDLAYSSITARVDGTAVDSNEPNYGAASALQNTGTATGVAIGMLGATSTVSGNVAGVLTLGSTSSAAPLTGSSGSKEGTLALAAQMILTDTAVDATPGTVVGTATVTFTYS